MNRTRTFLHNVIKVVTGVGLAVFYTFPLNAQVAPTLNLYGVTGLIDMPSGEQQPDGYMQIYHSQFGPISRTGLTFQILPRLSGSFRYVGIKDWNRKVPDVFATYYDRNFDLRYGVLLESRYLPAVTIGLQDFVGTGLSMGEYVAATKTFGPVKVTGGLGFGRLASYGPAINLFGPRPRIDFGLGGQPNYAQWFRGKAAPFGGIEYQVNDKLSLKVEYSSDAYRNESRIRETFDRRSPLNYGIEYQLSPMLHFSAYSMYGTEVGINLSVLLNLNQRPAGGIGGQAPEPVKPRPPISENPQLWSSGWLAQPTAMGLLIDNVNNHLARTGITVESLSVTGETAQVRYRNLTYDASAQAAGRVARSMSQTMPASVERFELVAVVNGLPASKVTVLRSDLERLEFAPDAGTALRARTTISQAGTPLPLALANPDLYPTLAWSIGPYAQTLLFDPREPFQYNVGVALRARAEVAPGIILQGAILKQVASNMLSPRKTPSELPKVRSRADEYYTEADPAIETLTAAWFGKLGQDLYGRVTVGYLEQMFAGISSEMLWKPVNSRYALGVEANYVAQRKTDGGLGFRNYRVASGHVSAYFDINKDFTGELNVGRYLAGDVGATFTLMRTFANGWQVGAFATFTNVSADDFGEGSFDKGIKMQIPLAWFVGQPTRMARSFTLRPIGRDGGARLNVDDRLAAVLRSYDQSGYDAQWGRFWK
ncbi:MAG: YjbH domain-containing protein [Candidatus Saccharibacteria bacterium]|nr:YjbH domain-containing protein [Pseudorhodobacter sp.]